MRSLYLIKRQPRPAHHKAPYHPIIVCDKKRIAEWEVGDFKDKAWLWERSWGPTAGGWLLFVWNGLIINYGPVAAGGELPDGTHAGFWRDYEDFPVGVQDLLPGAIWWSEKEMPKWAQDLGFVYPSDRFTQGVILDLVADDGAMGFQRPLPKHWRK